MKTEKTQYNSIDAFVIALGQGVVQKNEMYEDGIYCMLCTCLIEPCKCLALVGLKETGG